MICLLTDIQAAHIPLICVFKAAVGKRFGVRE
jgi:hypothetical protein